MIILSKDNENNPSSDLGTVVLEKDPQVKEPPSYQVVLINDDFTKVNFYSPSGMILCNPPYGKKLGNENETKKLSE